MNNWTGKPRSLLVGLGLLMAVGNLGCSADGMPPSRASQTSGGSPSATAAGSGATSGRAGSGGASSRPAAIGGAGGAAGTNPANTNDPVGSTSPGDDCAGDAPFKKEGCGCRPNETAACWTGPEADRNVGQCHDGLQICSGADEFATWGPCMGEELACGEVDAGVPDASVPPGECPCIPGSVIQCSEDCSVGIICSLTATKTCLPDKTWSVCREDMGVALDPPGVQCRNMLHGCLASTGGPMQGQGEVYVGDCSKQFECGKAPSPL